MSPSVLEQLNSKDVEKSEIDQQEIETALKSGFFDEEKDGKKNITTLLEELETEDTALENSLKENLGKAIVAMMEQKDITNRKNFGNLNPYTTEEIKMIQLWANIQFQDPIIIDGARGQVFKENQTNPYIWRLELGQKFEKTEDMLKGLTNEDRKDVLSQYYFVVNDINTVRQKGRGFEESVSKDIWEKLFVGLINKKLWDDAYVVLDDGIKKTKITIEEYIVAVKDNINDSIDVAVLMNKKYAVEKINTSIINMEALAKKFATGIDISANVKIIQEQYKRVSDASDEIYQEAKMSLIASIIDNFKESDIIKLFGNEISAESKIVIKKLQEDMEKTEKNNDIVTQFESNDQISLTQDVTREEYAKLYPNDANANKMGLKGTLGNYSGGIGSGNWEYKTRNDRVPSSIYKLHLSGMAPVVVRIPDGRFDIIDLINSGKKLVIPDFTYKYGHGNSSNSLGTSYNTKTMDYSEAEKNILKTDDFCIAEEDKSGGITVKNLEGKVVHSMTSEERDKARKSYGLALQTITNPEFETSVDILSDFNAEMTTIQEIYGKMATDGVDWGTVDRGDAVFGTMTGFLGFGDNIKMKGGLNDADVNTIFSKCVTLKNKLSDIRDNTSYQKELIALQKKLKGYNVSKNDLDSKEEQFIKNAISSIDYLIVAQKPGGAYDQFIDFMNNSKNVYSNDTFTEYGLGRLKQNGLQMLCAIGAAIGVILALPSAGSSLLLTAALTTLAGMVGSRLGQWGNEQIWNYVAPTTIMVDGKEIVIPYDDPTDVELLNQGKMERSEFATNIGTEFLIGTISVYGFMKAGTMIGTSLSKVAVKYPDSLFSKFLGKIKPAFQTGDDLYTQRLFNQINTMGNKTGYRNKFGKEFSQELGEEGSETLAEKLSEKSGIPGLSMLVTTWNCLTPSVANPKIFENNQVSISNMSKIDNKAILELKYDKGGSLVDLEQHFLKQGFTKNETTGELTKQAEGFDTSGLQQIIKLVPSVEPLVMRNTFANEFPNLAYNEETGEYDTTGLTTEELSLLQDKMRANFVLHKLENGFVALNSNSEIVFVDKKLNNSGEIEKNQSERQTETVQFNAQLEEGSMFKTKEVVELGIDGVYNSSVSTEGEDTSVIRPSQIEEIFGIKFQHYMSTITQNQWKELIQNKSKIEELGVKIAGNDICFLAKLKTNDRDALTKNKSKIETLGFKIDNATVFWLCEITGNNRDMLITNKSNMESLGIEITSENIKFLCSIKQPVRNALVEKYPRVKNELGIKIYDKDVNNFKKNMVSLYNIKRDEFDVLITNKGIIKFKLGIDINITNISVLLKVTKSERDALMKNKLDLKNKLGIIITDKNVEYLHTVERESFWANMPKLNELGIQATESNIANLSKITEAGRNVLMVNKSKINELGIQITESNVVDLSKVNETERDALTKNKLDLRKKLGITIDNDNWGLLLNVNRESLRANSPNIGFDWITPFNIRTWSNFSEAQVKSMSEKDHKIMNTGIRTDIGDYYTLSYLNEEIIDSVINNRGKNIKELKDILSNEKDTGKIKEYSDRINRDKENIANIINGVVEKIDALNDVTLTTAQQSIEEVYPMIKDMDGKVQWEIISTINKYVMNIITINQYLNLPKYKNNPEELIADMRGFKRKPKPEGKITVERKGASLLFYISEGSDYMTVYTKSPGNISYTALNSGGFSTQDSQIKGLKNTLIVAKGEKGSAEYVQTTEIHEKRHGLNSLLFRDREGNEPKTLAKDEIIAYMKDGRSKEAIVDTLTNPKGLYTYGMKANSSEWKNHVQEVKKAIDISFKLKDANVPNYLELIAITPVNKLYRLEDIYITGKDKTSSENFIAHGGDLLEEGVASIGGLTENLGKKIRFYDIVQRYKDRFNAMITGDNSFIVNFAKKFKNLVNSTKDFFKKDPEISKELDELGEIEENMSDVENILPLEEQSVVRDETVQFNAQLEDGPRLLKAEELLGIKLTPEQQQAILTAHNQEGTLYNLNFTQIKARADILSKAGFTSEQIRKLIENGICGQAEAKTLDVNKDGMFDESDVEMMGDNQQILTNELAQTNPTKYQEILIEKFSADPTYKDIIEAMNRTGTRIVIDPSLDSRGAYDKGTKTLKMNPTRENRNDGSLWGEGGYGTLSGDKLTLAVFGHEMHHFLFENTLQKNRGASYEKIKNKREDDYEFYEIIITYIGSKIEIGKSFVYHTNTQSGIDAYRSYIKQDDKGENELDTEGNPILDKELNDYLVAEENVIELSRLYSQGQLDEYLQYLVDTERSILDEKGLQKITEKEKVEIFMYIEMLVDGAKDSLLDFIPKFSGEIQPSIDPEIVKANAILADGPRLLKAEELLGIKLTPEQQQAILTAHNQEGTLYNLNFTQIKARADILSKAGFTSEQIRVLLENGICGQPGKNVLDVNQNGIFDVKDVEMISNRYKEGVDAAFQQNPELANIGTKQEYMEYLDTIFPNSKMKGILYHASPAIFDEFRENPFGIFFSNDYLPDFGKHTYIVIVNAEKLLKRPGKNATEEERTKYREEYNKINRYEWVENGVKEDGTKNYKKDYIYDSVVERSTTSYDGIQFRVRKPEQIHILGSQQDADGFKNFVDSKNKNNAVTEKNMTNDKVKTLQQKGYLITENDGELIEKCDITTLPLLKGIPFELVSKAQKDNLKQNMSLEKIMPQITPEIKTKYEAYVKYLENANKNPSKIKIIMDMNPDMVELQKSLINRMFVMGEENLKSFREITNNLAILSGGRKPEGVAKFEMKENAEGKNMDRLITKTNMENDGDISGLSDILRTTIIFDTLEGMNAGIAKMLASEYFQQGKVSIKNRINAAFACDMIIKFEMPTGFVAEIQLHTPESYKAKHEGMEVDTEHIDMGNGTFESITEADRDLIETLKDKGKIDKESILPENNQKVSTTYIYDIRRDMAPYTESDTKIADLYNKLGKLEIQINKHYMAEYEKTKGSFSY